MSPFILKLGTRWGSVVSFMSGGPTPLSIELEARWVLEALWTLWRREISFARAGNRSTICPF